MNTSFMNKLTILLIILFLAAGVYGQDRTITGKVVDDNNMPLISATVVALGPDGTSKSGTSTDMDGHFTLDLPAGIQRILVSYVGFQSREVDIAGKNDLLVQLNPSAMELEDVVVTALGIRKEKKAL